MEFLIQPYIGVGGIKFGMKNLEIKSKMGTMPINVQYTEKKEIKKETYQECFVYFKPGNICEAIEFHEPAKVIFMGRELLHQPYQNIKEFMLKYDENLNFDNAGFTSYRLGIGIYAPFAEEAPQDPVEGVIVFEKGYYD